MEPNPPLTAKQAALLGAQADKPPFNPQSDRRHVIASIIRRTGEAMGNGEQSAEAADAIQSGAAGFDEAAPLELFGGPNQQAQQQMTAEWAAPIDSSATGDTSLAQIIAADQAASRGFAAPAMSAEDVSPLRSGSSMDALHEG